MNRHRLGLLAAVSTLTVLVLAAACAGGGDATVAPAPAAPSAPAAAAPEPAPATSTAPEPQKGQPQRGGTLLWGSAKEMSSPHPYTTTASVDGYIKETMFEPLIRQDKDGAFRGMLAESWTVSDDASVWTFKLREGVKFHNGQEMTADDLIWSVNFILDPDNAARGRGALNADIEKLEKVDKYTVKFILKGPRGLFGLTIAEISRLHVIPAGSIKTGDIKVQVPPPGTGPFRFKDWVPADKTEVVRFDDYWRDPYPYLDGIVFKLIQKSSGRQNALRAGDVQMAERLRPTFAQRVQKGEITGIQLDPATLSGFRRFEFNFESPLFQDRRMREAIVRSIDRQAFMDEVYFGLGQPMVVPVPPGSDWEAAVLKVAPMFELDTNRSKQLAQEAGYNGEPIRFIVERGQGEPIGESIGRMLRKAGFNIKLEVLESGVYDEKQATGDYDLTPHGASFRGDPIVAAAGSIRCEEGERHTRNQSRYCNPKIDALLDEYLTVSDHQKHLEIYAQIMKTVLRDDIVMVYMGWNRTRFFGWRDNIRGFGHPGHGAYTAYEKGLFTTWIER